MTNPNAMTKLYPAHAALAAELEQAGFGLPAGRDELRESALVSFHDGKLHCGKCGSALVECQGPTHYNAFRCPTCIGFSHLP